MKVSHRSRDLLFEKCEYSRLLRSSTLFSGSFAHHVNDFVSPGKLNCKFPKANLVKVESASCGFDCAEIILSIKIVCQGMSLIGKCLT